MSNQTSQSEMKHTTEPWAIGIADVLHSHGTQITGMLEISRPFILASFNHNFETLARANVARAVACVNAMQGIPDPAEYVRVFGEMVSVLEVVTRKLEAAYIDLGMARDMPVIVGARAALTKANTLTRGA